MEMPKKKIHFMGFLANTDSSILDVKLDHGFKIHALTDREGITLISIFESLNRCASDFAITSSKFLASLGISDMPRTLAETPHDA